MQPSTFQLFLAIILSGVLGYVIHERMPAYVGEFLAKSDVVPFFLLIMIGAFTINIGNLTPHIAISLILVSLLFAIIAKIVKTHVNEALANLK